MKENDMISLTKSLIACGGLLLAALEPAQAQWAVVDAPAIVQLVQEVQTMSQELQTARDQLTQAQQALQTMTGNRGMEYLLGNVPRNYLPASWSQLTGAIQGNAAGYPSLVSDVATALRVNAVLSPQQLTALSPGARQSITASRESNALQQAVAQAALVNSSGRFASLQRLINAISGAADQKGILDLQARINGELAMLQNEQTKVQVLQQAALAQQAVNQEQDRELAIAAQGDFASRFQPKP
jgi:type IV secretion system protein VirB5